MKICSPQLGLSSNSTLGGEVHDHFILQGLAGRGHKIFVYLPKGRSHQANKNIIVSYAPVKHIPAFLFNILVLPYLFSLYREERFDILRVHNPYFVGLGALLFRVFHPEVKIVTTYHLAESSLMFNLINSLTVFSYDAIITVSNYLKNWLIRKYKVNPARVHTIYNGVDPFLGFKPKNEKLVKKYRLNGKFVILFMGLLIPRKNPLFLLEVFKNLKQKHENVSLIICGEGPLKSKVIDFIHRNHLNDVLLVEPVFGKDKVDLFNICDIFALPSQNEGFGIVVAEAMACAKPIIASDNSSLKEIVENGESGLVVEENNKKEWIKKIESLKNDKSLYIKLSRGALVKSRQYQWTTVARKYQQVLEKLTDA